MKKEYSFSKIREVENRYAAKEEGSGNQFEPGSHRLL
jgi:hypothetical protein